MQEPESAIIPKSEFRYMFGTEHADLKTYRGTSGRCVFVAPGLGGESWMSFWTDNGVGRHRVKSPSLPPRQSMLEAQSDLDAYAIKHGWEVVDGYSDAL